MRTLQPLRPEMPHGGHYRGQGCQAVGNRKIRLHPVRVLRGNLPEEMSAMKQSYTEPDGTKKTDSFIKTNMPEPAAKPAAGQEAAKPAAKAEAAQPAAKPEAAQTAGQEHT